MNILILNQNWFADEFRTLGHRVITFGRAEHMEVRQPKLMIAWNDVKALLPSDFKPELVLFHDNSMPVLITELETIDVPTVFYSVDTHHHASFHKYLGEVFTHTFVAQKDFAGEFHELNIHPHWLPLWASEFMEPKAEKKRGAVFVGTLNPKLNADRVKFFDELQKVSAVEVTTGYFPQIFPESRIVINQTVKGDLNFRVFEAMMSGAMLLTERSGNGLGELFEDGKHLVLYEKGNVRDAAEKINYYLNNPQRAADIAKAGRDLVLHSHQAINRAQFVLEKLASPTSVGKGMKFGAVRNFSALADKLFDAGEKLLSMNALVEVMRIVNVCIHSDAKPDTNISLDIIKALVALRVVMKPEVITAALEDFRRAYPEQLLFHMLKINDLVEAGDNASAHQLAASVSALPSEEVLMHAQNLIKEITPKLNN